MKRNIYFYNRCRASFALASSVAMAILVFTGVLLQLFTTSDITGYSGTEAFRFFTVDSNLLVGVCALLSIPYQVDGIRSGNYHMPRWIVYLLFVGVCTVTMTFLIAACVLAPAVGVVYVLFSGANLFLHLLNPVVSIALFIFIACDHMVKFKFTFIAMIPVVVYAVVYIVEAFIIGEANGGWKDHYQLGTYVPWPVAAIIMFAIYFAICVGVRALHNLMHKKEKKTIRSYYDRSPEFQRASIEEAIAALAKDDKSRDPKNNDIVVPRRIVEILKEKYQSEQPLEVLCLLYLEEYLKR